MDWIAKNGNITTNYAFETEKTTPVVEDEVEKSSMLPIILTVIAVALIVGAMSFYLYRREKKYELEAFEPVEKDEESTMVDEDEDLDDVYSDPFPEEEKERERDAVLVN